LRAFLRLVVVSGLLAPFAAWSQARHVDVFMAHALRTGADERGATPCSDCAWVEVEDIAGRATAGSLRLRASRWPRVEPLREVESGLPGAPKPRVVPEAGDTEPQGECRPVAHGDVDPEIVWAQGRIRHGRKDGLWLGLDYHGEPRRIDHFRDGCLVATERPTASP